MALAQLGGLQTAEALAGTDVPPSGTDALPSEAVAASGSAIPMPSPLGAEAAWQRTVRQQWLLGRIAELRRQPAAAATALEACRQLLESGSATPQPAAEAGTPSEQPAPAGGPASEPPFVSRDAAAEQQPLAAGPDSEADAAAAAVSTPSSVRLRGCTIDAVITAEAVDAKLQVCPRCVWRCCLSGGGGVAQ